MFGVRGTILFARPKSQHTQRPRCLAGYNLRLALRRCPGTEFRHVFCWKSASRERSEMVPDVSPGLVRQQPWQTDLCPAENATEYPELAYKTHQHSSWCTQENIAAPTTCCAYYRRRSMRDSESAGKGLWQSSFMTFLCCLNAVLSRKKIELTLWIDILVISAPCLPLQVLSLYYKYFASAQPLTDVVYGPEVRASLRRELFSRITLPPYTFDLTLRCAGANMPVVRHEWMGVSGAIVTHTAFVPHHAHSKYVTCPGACSKNNQSARVMTFVTFFTRHYFPTCTDSFLCQISVAPSPLFSI